MTPSRGAVPWTARAPSRPPGEGSGGFPVFPAVGPADALPPSAARPRAPTRAGSSLGQAPADAARSAALYADLAAYADLSAYDGSSQPASPAQPPPDPRAFAAQPPPDPRAFAAQPPPDPRAFAAQPGSASPALPQAALGIPPPPAPPEQNARLPAFRAASPAAAVEPRTFFAIRDDGATLGPLDLGDLGRVLREARVAHLSIAGEPTAGADDARAGLGIAEPTTAELQLRDVSVVGTLEPRGLTHVLCRLAVTRSSARVVVIGEDERLFADVVDGALTFVSASRGGVDPLTLGLATNLLGRDELESLALGALRGRLQVLGELRRHRPRLVSRLMAERTEALLRMPSGRYAVGQPGVVPLQPSFALQPTALHRLHELMQRTHMAAAIWAWLGARADQALRATARWNDVTDLLGLKHDEMIWASRLAQGASAAEVARSTPDDAAAVAALAWVLVEAEALVAPQRP
jgi:hypothetical protein